MSKGWERAPERRFSICTAISRLHWVRPECLRERHGLQPVIAQGPAQHYVVLQIQRFDEERIGSHIVGSVNIPDVRGGGENHDDKAAYAELLAYPLQQFEAIELRQF